MKNKVYSTQRGKQFNSILKLIEMGNKELAKKELRKVLNYYYYNEAALSVYVRLLFMDGEFDKVKELSEEYLDNREIAYYYALVLKYSGDIEKSKELFMYSYNEGKIRALIQYIVILIKEENYEEAYKQFIKIPEKYALENELEVNILRRYIYKNIYPGLNDVIKSENLRYFTSQIVDYDDSALEEKIEKNQMLGRSKFKGEIDIKDVISYVKEKIENAEPSYYDLFDRYVIEYPKVGTVDKKNTDYLMVITNLNTKEIVNIYPCSGVYINNVEKSDVMTKKYIIE